MIQRLRIERTSSMRIVREIVENTGDVQELVVFSYSITDVWMRQLMNLKTEKGIAKVVMVFDRDVIIRHREKLHQLQFIADEVYLTDTHAKVYMASNNNKTTVAVTSANATNNLRNECFFITDGPETEEIQSDIRGILAGAFRVI
jgi:hypothetical protein